MWRAPLSGLPQGEAHGTRDHHTPDDSITYPDMLSGSLTHVPPPSDGVSRRPVRTSFAMDSKELSSISNYFGDKKAIKTPKLNTI